MESTGRITREIISRLREKPAEGLEEFVDRYGARLLVFIRYRLGSRLASKVEAEDVLQDFFASLVDQPERFLDKVEERGVHRAAFRLLENRIKDLYEHHFETQKRSGEREVSGDAERGTSRSPLIAQLAGPTASISRRIEAEDEYTQLQRLVDGLEDRNRQLFVLKFVQEFSNQEIAEELDCSLSTVKRETQGLVREIQRLRRGA